MSTLLFCFRHVQILSLLLLLATSISKSKTHVDICDSVTKVTPEEIHEGIFVDIATVERGGVQTDRNGNYCELKLRLNKTHGERTEISFYKMSTRDIADCFDISFGDRDNRLNNGFSLIHCHSMPPTEEHRKVFFTRDGLDDISIKVHSEVLSAAPINAGIFVQNRRVDAEVKTARFSGAVKFSCSHPNTFIHPNLFHDANNLTNELSGVNLRDFERRFEDSPTPEDAGRYDCSWTPSVLGASLPKPQTSIKAVLYSSLIKCSANTISGANISVVVFPVPEGGVADETFNVKCRLNWSGDINGLKLRWRKINDDEDGNSEGDGNDRDGYSEGDGNDRDKDNALGAKSNVSNDLNNDKHELTFTNTDNGRQMSAEFHFAPKTTTTTFVCSLPEIGFVGPAPKPCSVTFRISEDWMEKAEASEAMAGIYGVVTCVSVILLFILVCCLLQIDETLPPCVAASEKICCWSSCCPGLADKLVVVGDSKTENVSLSPTEFTVASVPAEEDLVRSSDARSTNDSYEKIRY